MSRLLPLVLLAACTGYEPVTGDPTCPVVLACPAPVEASCTGPETAVTLGEASVCDLAWSRNDQLATYPIGQTTVSWEAGYGGFAGEVAASCQTVVTVVDDSAPEVTCEADFTVVREGPEDTLPDPPAGTATDLCDPGGVTLEVTPESLSAPSTTVTTIATDSAGNSASCSTTVDVIDLFPASELRVLGAGLAGGTTEFTLGWEPPESDDVAQLEVQRGDSASGPWTRVDAVSASNVNVTLTTTQTGWYRLLSTDGGELSGAASDPILVHAVEADGYDLSDQPVPGIGFATSLYGVVRHPVDLDGGPYPLVVLIHGNHGNCRQNGTTNDGCLVRSDHACDFPGYSTTPNAEGMAYEAETLAAQGMVAVSISANALNCRGGYIIERAQLVTEHLRRWKSWHDGVDGAMGTKFAGNLDLMRTGLVGHSRGGDAVSWVPQILDDTPIDGVDVVSIFAIAPTDYNDATVFGASWALLLPACDGDVSTLWGSDIYERSREDVWHKAQVLMAGANHNYFSTEWTFDDGARVCPRSALVGLDTQTSMLEATLGSWMVRTLDEDVPEAFHRAEQEAPAMVAAYIPGQEDLRWSYTQDDALVLEAFADDPNTNVLGGTNSSTGFSAVVPCTYTECGSTFLHRWSAIDLRWTGGEPSVTMDFAGADLSAYGALSFRVVSAVDGLNGGRREQPYELTFTDGAGQSVVLTDVDLVPVRHSYSAYTVREVMQTVRVPFEQLTAANAAFDPSTLAGVQVAFGTDEGSGAVTVTDVELGY